MKIFRLTIGVMFLLRLAPGLQAVAQDKPKIEVVAQIGHSDLASVNSVAFSPDGRRVLSGGSDQTVKLWDTDTGRLVRTFAEHSGHVDSVAFSPDGRSVLSGSFHLKLWDAATGRLIRTFDRRSDDEMVGAAAFSPDGGTVLSAISEISSGKKSLKLWDVGTGQLVRTFQGDAGTVFSVKFSPDGRSVLSGGSDQTVKLWNVATGGLVRTLGNSADGHSRWVKSVAFSLDGHYVLSGSQDRTLKLWRVATGRLVRTFHGHSHEVSSVAFSPDGRTLISSSLDKTVRLWNATTGAVLRTFEEGTMVLPSVAFSPDGRRVLAGSDWRLKLWDAATGELLRTFEGGLSFVQLVAVSPDGTSMVSDRWEKLRLWDLATGRLVHILEGHSDAVNSVAFSPDGRSLISGSNDRTIRLWETATGRLLRTVKVDLWVEALAFSPDGRSLLTGGNDLKLFDAATGKLLRTFEERTAQVRSVAFSPDGLNVLSGHQDGTLRIWDLSVGRVIRTIEAHLIAVDSVAYSPDGGSVISGQGDDIKLWDATTGALVHTFEGHDGVTVRLAFSPDGRNVISGRWDQTIKLWDTATGQLIRTFEGHLAPVKSIAVLPDGRSVVSASDDGTIRVWSRSTGQEAVRLLAGYAGDWLALTPAGFFDFKRSIENSAHLVRGLDVLSIGQVHQSLYNPDLLREALAGDPSREVERAAEVINLEKVIDSGPAPLVAITSPMEGSETKTDVVTVRARITDRGKGIGRIEWRVNGVTAAVAAKPPGRGPAYTVTQQLALDVGDNTIEVVAYNARNLLSSLPARTTIKFTGAADTTRPKLHVLAIGINKYVDKGWSPPGTTSDTLLAKPLNLAVNDADAVAEHLKKAAGSQYADVKVTLLTDEGASRDGIERAINKLASEILPRDTFIFFAAAHGVSEMGRFYLIPQDYQSGPDALARQAIDQERVQDWFANRISAKKAIILLDTCESGALVAGHTRSRTDSPASEAAIGRLHEATGRPVLTAAALGQDAWEGVIAQTGDRHGVFTWAVLDALRHGDTNNDGSIDLSELATHVQNRVAKAELKGPLETTLSLVGRQSARFGSRGENFVLVQRLQ